MFSPELHPTNVERWLSRGLINHHCIWGVKPCSTNMVIERVSFLYFGRVFNKAIIPLALVGYEMFIANWALRASLTIYHLMSKAHSWNNCWLNKICIASCESWKIYSLMKYSQINFYFNHCNQIKNIQKRI